MAGPGDVDAEAQNLTPWNVGAIALAALYLAGLVLLGWAAMATAPSMAAHKITAPILSAYGKPSSGWPAWLQIALGISAFFCYYVPRRRETRSFSLIITAVLGVTTIALGFVTVLSCPPPGESRVLSALTSAVGLVLGSSPDLQGNCGITAAPLAMQVAKLFGPALLVFTALGIVVTVFRAQLDRIRVRYARALVVVVGLTEDAMPMLRRLATDARLGLILAVLVEDASNPLIRQARNLGARVVVGDLGRINSIRVLMLRGGRFKVEALYLVSADVSVNLGWAVRFRDIADASRTVSTDKPPRITVRIDDPWQAEYWRRTNAYRTPEPDGNGAASDSVRWVSDALSIHEVTAAILVEHVQSAPHDRLVIVGRSPLALAICAELAQREREDGLLGIERRPSFGELLLVGVESADVREQHQIRQERFGNTASATRIELAEEEASEPALDVLLSQSSAPAVIFADDLTGERSADLSATLLAAIHPNWTIYHLDPGATGLPPRAIMERLYPFGLTIEPPRGDALDSWERAARIVHQTFLDSLDQLDPTKPTHRPWERLDPFYRASNVRLVTTTLAGAESIGRAWGPPAADDEWTSSASPAELEQMAKFEHRSWRRFYEENRWRYATERNDPKRRHDALVGWGQLPPRHRERTVGSVEGALGTLQALGYRSWRLAPSPWTKVLRRGEVTAEIQDHGWTWTNKAGERLRARPGDYKVSDASGGVWSVEPAIFEQTYERIDGDRWQRTGTVLARVAEPGEFVVSIEGPETARPGDWVLRGSAGEQWIIDGEHFRRSYRPAGTDAGATGESAASAAAQSAAIPGRPGGSGV